MLFTSYVLLACTVGLIAVATIYGYKMNDGPLLALCAVAVGCVALSVAGIVPEKIAVGAVLMPAVLQLARLGAENHDTA